MSTFMFEHVMLFESMLYMLEFYWLKNLISQFAHHSSNSFVFRRLEQTGANAFLAH